MIGWILCRILNRHDPQEREYIVSESWEFDIAPGRGPHGGQWVTKTAKRWVCARCDQRVRGPR
jgi:hypothetical protein